MDHVLRVKLEDDLAVDGYVKFAFGPLVALFRVTEGPGELLRVDVDDLRVVLGLLDVVENDPAVTAEGTAR